MTALLLALLLSAAPVAAPAQSGATGSNPAAQSTPAVCGPACRWTPGAQERTRAAWPEIRAAADLEGQAPVLLASVAAWESEMRPIRGGLRNEMWGPGQVHCRTWLAPLQERHSAPGLVCDDLLTLPWGLAASALALRHAIAFAGGRIETGLCVYGAGLAALAWESCPYARAVLAVEALVRRDLGDIVEDRT